MFKESIGVLWWFPWSCALRACVLGVLYVLGSFGVLYEPSVPTCLACFQKWRSWRA